MKIFVVGQDHLTRRMFERGGHEVQTILQEDTDVMVFTGGADVSPFLYGERPLPGTKFDINRDLQDVYFWKNAPEHIPKVGICRGSQLGNVLSGGRLWQDVDAHAGCQHVVRDITSRTKEGHFKHYFVTSTHHQQSILAESAILIAAANNSNQRQNYRFIEQNKGDWNDVEAFYYPLTNFLGVQFHPEYPNLDQCTNYFWDLFNTWLEIPKPKPARPTVKSIML